MSDNKNRHKTKETTNDRPVVTRCEVVFDNESTWDRLQGFDEDERKLLNNANAPRPVPSQALKQKYTIIKPRHKMSGGDKKRPTYMSDFNL